MATKMKSLSGGKESRWVEDDRVAGVFRVHRSAFVDQGIYDLERERIFSRCWLFVGHESEIPLANDFLTRNVGGREIIFNRDRAGKVGIFLNTCTHRGAMVERRDKGNAISFKCFYHGWAFNNNGTFGTKMHVGDYGAEFNKDGCLNLRKVPQFGQYAGFYFLNYAASAEPLDDYLAGSRDILDLLTQHGPDGIEVIGTDQKYAIRANWKLLMENSYDGYHAADTHQTYFEYLADAVGAPVGMPEENYVHDYTNGHAAVEGVGPWGRPVAKWTPQFGVETKGEIEAIRQELVDRLGPERAERIAVSGRNTGFFPNLIINDIMSVTIRTFYPTGPDHMNVSSWAIGVKGESKALRKRRLDNFLEFLGPGGFSTPDDVEALESAQRGYAASREVEWNDISRGMLREGGPKVTDEEQMRCFWREWSRRMEG